MAVESIEGLTIALREAGPAAAWISRARFDPEHPYGRRILWVEDELELMIAGWSRGHPCAPHDHGPGLGVVRVLQGRVRHRDFALHEGTLVPDLDERLDPGALIACPLGRIHQMEDDGAKDPLITLHIYLGLTTPMAVYDIDQGGTQWLGPGSGAWPRPLGDVEVQGWSPGFV